MRTYCSWTNRVCVPAKQPIVSIPTQSISSWTNRVFHLMLFLLFLFHSHPKSNHKALVTSETGKLTNLIPVAFNPQRTVRLDGRWGLTDWAGHLGCGGLEWDINEGMIVLHSWVLDHRHQEGEHLGFGVDNRVSPSTIDIWFLDHLDFPDYLHGIYKVEGDVLTVCLCTSIHPRPVGFTRTGQGYSLLCFRRKKEQH